MREVVLYDDILSVASDGKSTDHFTVAHLSENSAHLIEVSFSSAPSLLNH